MIGKTLGHYQITNQLGKGGMGEVFQAKDQVLGRDVAIKVLPEEFARDADRVARFQREAKVLASLNHPNIAAIYGLEASDGTNFLVLELVEGQTLADRIKAGPIPVEEALKLALQIAEALEAAHERGVIHRDLKPSNIKVTPDGKVKVLDFGLAKAYAGDREEVNLSNSPTLSDAATQKGVILGTAAYMSPEQARGDAVDKRADIWAFGVVLFEMLTGRGMFEGRTVSDTLAAVLMREPDWKRLPPNLHPRIRLLLERCLEKDPKDRYGSINDARVDIQRVLADPSGVSVQPAVESERQSKLRLVLPWVAAALIVAAVIAGIAVWKLKPSEPRKIVRFEYQLPKEQQISNPVVPILDVSPDGDHIVYCTEKGIYLRSVGELTAKHISGTEEHTEDPFFSPDGKWIGYRSEADGKIKKIAVSGGAPVILCDAPQLMSARWSTDDMIVYATWDHGIMRVSANGGTPESIIKQVNGPSGFPQILPDGKSILYTANFIGPQSKIMVWSPKGDSKELFPGNYARYLPTGHLIYSVGSTLLAVQFDVDKLEPVGGPIPVVEGVMKFITPEYAVSDSGTLAYLPGKANESLFAFELVWVDREGKEESLRTEPRAYGFPRISPDGKRLALTIGGPLSSDIWIWDVIRKNLTRLTFETTNAVGIWTPDGKRIAYTSEGDRKVYVKSADGTGKTEPLVSLPDAELYPFSWSDDGKTVVLEDFSHSDIGIVSIEGDRKWKSLLKEKYAERQPRLSPDGRWIAYTSNESGKNEVYVRPFPDVDSGGKWQVSVKGGSSPLWSPDGRELFYCSDDSVMVVPVRTAPSFGLETPKALFKGPYYFEDSIVSTTWDISPDGKRFLMMKPASEATPSGGGKINIVLNWIEELKQRVPIK